MDLETVSAADFGRSLMGLGVNLLSPDVRGAGGVSERGSSVSPSTGSATISPSSSMMALCFNSTTTGRFRAHPVLGLVPETPATRGWGAVLPLRHRPGRGGCAGASGGIHGTGAASRQTARAARMHRAEPRGLRVFPSRACWLSRDGDRDHTAGPSRRTGSGEGPDGRTIYAARTLPGEVIAGENRWRQDRDARHRGACCGSGVERAFYACITGAAGAGALMHASDSFVADWKTQVIATALAAQGLDAAIRPIADLPAPGGRGGAATLPPPGGGRKKGALVGFSHARRSDTIVPITDCHVSGTGSYGSRARCWRTSPGLAARGAGGAFLRDDPDGERRGPARDGGQAARRAAAGGAGRVRGPLRASDMGG